MQRTKLLTHGLHPARAVLRLDMEPVYSKRDFADVVSIFRGEMHGLPVPGKVCSLGDSHLTPSVGTSKLRKSVVLPGAKSGLPPVLLKFYWDIIHLVVVCGCLSNIMPKKPKGLKGLR